jgi:acetylornithine deacetylase/succinyl-diaminopimelate desuccinylase-like protein
MCCRGPQSHLARSRAHRDLFANSNVIETIVVDVTDGLKGGRIPELVRSPRDSGDISVVDPGVARRSRHIDIVEGITVNVGLIEGGTAKNTVPDFAKCVVDARFHTQSDANALVAAMNALVASPFRDVARLEEAHVNLEGGVMRPPMEATTGNQELRRRYENCATQCGLQVGEAPLQGGGSDANLLAGHGVPCIDGLGPAGDHFHKVEEWASLDSLQRRTEALALFLLNDLRQDDGSLDNEWPGAAK